MPERRFANIRVIEQQQASYRQQTLNPKGKNMHHEWGYFAITIAPFVLVGGLMLTPSSGNSLRRTEDPDCLGGQPHSHTARYANGCDAPGYLCRLLFYQGGFQGFV